MYHARSRHQSLRTFTVYITAFSKEKARTFYAFPFYSFHYLFHCCVPKFLRYFLSRASLFCLLLCCPDKQGTCAIGRERIEDGKPCVTSMAIILFEENFSYTLPSFKYPASRKIEATSPASRESFKQIFLAENESLSNFCPLLLRFRESREMSVLEKCLWGYGYAWI